MPIPIKVLVSPPNVGVTRPAFSFRRGSRRLIFIPLDPSCSFTETNLWKLGRQYYEAVMGHSKLAPLTAFFTTVTIDTAVIDQVCKLTIDASQRLTDLMYVCRRQQNIACSDSICTTMMRPFLGEIDDFTTEAFRCYQSILSSTAKPVRNDPELANGTQHEPYGNCPKQLIVIRTSLNRGMISGIFIVLLVIGVVLGIIVGLCSTRADIGIALSAAVFTLSSCLQILTVGHEEC